MRCLLLGGASFSLPLSLSSDPTFWDRVPWFLFASVGYKHLSQIDCQCIPHTFGMPDPELNARGSTTKKTQRTYPKSIHFRWGDTRVVPKPSAPLWEY